MIDYAPKNKKVFSWSAFFFASLILIPYLDTGWIRKNLTYKTDRIYVYPIIFFMLVVIFFSVVHKFINKDKRILSSKEYNCVYLFCIYTSINVAFRSISNKNFDVSFVQYLWAIVPMIYSIIVIGTIKNKLIDIEKIIDYYLYLIAGYCIFSVLIYIKNFGYNFELTTRISGGSGSGGLLFSYTLVLAYGLLILRKEFIPLLHSIIIMFIYLGFILLSGSRIAIVFALILTFLFILKSKHNFRKIVNTILLLLFLIICQFFDLYSQLLKVAPRLSNMTSGIRGVNFISSLKLFVSDNILNEFIGRGLGQFFPYQDWFLHHVSVLDITFMHNGMIFIVQPHNSFIHILLELGIIGLILFMMIICSLYKKALQHQSRNCKTIISFIFVSVIILNCFDSAFTINPGVASIWWIILFLLTCYKEE